MICGICGTEFEGRPNRLYCSKKCRRRAEMSERNSKKAEKWAFWMERREAKVRDFYASLPTADEMFEQIAGIKPSKKAARRDQIERKRASNQK